MEFLQGEQEARYAWDTAGKFARQRTEEAARMAALSRAMFESWANVLRGVRAAHAAPTRRVVMRSAPSPYKDPRTGRERFEFNRRPRLADYPPGWQPCTGKQLADALDAGWKPPPPSINTGYQAYMAAKEGGSLSGCASMGFLDLGFLTAR